MITTQKSIPTIGKIKERLEYDPIKGSLVYKNTRDSAIFINKHGESMVRIGFYIYKASHIIYKYMTNNDVKKVRYIDNNPTNLVWTNLKPLA